MLSREYNINTFTETKLKNEYINYFRLFDDSKYEAYANTNEDMRGVLVMIKRSIPLKIKVIERSTCGNS